MFTAFRLLCSNQRLVSTTLLTSIRHYGTSLGNPSWLNRNIIIANSISLMLCALNILLQVVNIIVHPGDKSFYVGIFNASIHLLIPFINRAGYVNFGRTLVTLTLTIGGLALTVTRKLSSPELIPMNTFFQSRTAITIFCVVPFTMINFRERALLVTNLLICLIVLLLFDPIHNALGVGFYQLGFTDPDFYFTNVVHVVIFLVLAGSTGFFKYEMDNYSRRNEQLIEALHARTEQIEEQKEELNSQGEMLKELLKEKDKDLSQVTQELINFNHELLQYSYTVSHNLRGPVARILGLLDLYFHHSDEKEKKNIIGLINESTRELDTITLILNKIVEARSDSFTVREEVNFSTELTQIRKLLESPIKNYGVKLTEDLKVQEIFSAKQRINHILYILLTNAIQYRRNNIPLQIKVSTYKKGDWVVLEVHDNGRGIDLKLYRDNLFKPFKYFHSEASGKGVSLYLAKLQAERLHGYIDVKSTPGAGAVFSVYLKDWQPASQN
jgi:signal transduction histidine kinase